MKLKEMRRIKGLDIRDVSRETAISLDLLYAFEKGKYLLSDEDIMKLSSCYDQDFDEIKSSFKNLREGALDDVHELITPFLEYGYFPLIRQCDDEEKKTFIYLMNVIWEYYYKGLIRATNKSTSEIMKSFKEYFLVNELRFDSSNAFIYTYNIENAPNSCIVKLLDTTKTTDGSLLIKICELSTISSITSYKNEFMKLIEMIRTRSNVSKDKVRIFHKDCMNYVEFDLNGDQMEIRSNIPEEVYNNKSRIYREIRSSEDMPHIYFHSDSDCRCSEDKIGNCPMKNNNIPSDSDGCSYCRMIKNIWEAREFLLKKISEEEFKNMQCFYDFQKSHYELCKEFEKRYGREAMKLYDLAYKFSNFRIYNGDNIKIVENSYENGRHRSKIAINMGIDIPVLILTDKVRSDELLEEDICFQTYDEMLQVLDID